MKITFSLACNILVLLAFIYTTVIGVLIGNSRQTVIFLVLSMIMGYITGRELRSCRDAYKEQRRLEIGGPLDNPHNP